MRNYFSKRKWVIGFALVIYLVTLIPYVSGFQQENDQWVFTGFTMGVEDGNSYIAKMLRGSAGEFLFETPYTAFGQNGILAFIPYTLLGKLAAGVEIHDQLVAIFQLFRLLGCILMTLSTYDFLCIFIQDTAIRRMALAFAIAGGGLGWLAALGLSGLWSTALPLEYYSPETFGFLSIFSLPHLAVSRSLLLWGLMVYIENLSRPDFTFRKAWIGGLLWFVMGFFQPLAIVTGWAILAGFLAIYGLLIVISKKRRQKFDWSTWISTAKSAVVMGLISSPWVIYNFINSITDPYLQGWASQNIILSPAVTDYLLAFGAILPFALLTGYSILRSGDVKGLFLVAWVAIFPILAYLPYLLQRRLPEGIWVGMTVLGFLWFEKLDQKKRRWAAALLGFSLLPAIIIEMGSIVSLQNKTEPMYVRQNEVLCYQAVNKAAQLDDVILTSYETGNNLPAWAPVKVLIGHGPESIHMTEIRPKVEKFYQASTDRSERLELIQEFNIHYIYWGIHEAKLGDWKPAAGEGYQLVYENTGCEVWLVIGEEQ